VNLALTVGALEWVGLAAYHRETGRGVPPRALAGNLLAGACLLAALRGAVGGRGLGWIAPCLAGAGLAHVADLRQRWPR
jgi:hypothetical protein